MSVGIRIRGVGGQLQISDDAPVNSVLFAGNLGNLVAYTQNGLTTYATGVTFPAVITTTEQPMVFIRVTNTVEIVSTRVIGQPGAWTGFSVWGTDSTDTPGGGANPAPVYGTWFVATTQSGKSNAKYGIRIRNPNTGVIVFDSGFPIVKFLSWVPQFNNFRVISTAHDNSGRTGWWDWCQVDTGIPYIYNAHFLMNGFTGLITGAPGGETVFARLFFNAGNPGALTVDFSCPQGTGQTVFGRNAWNLIWATPGP
jgi:hypothetical protein